MRLYEPNVLQANNLTRDFKRFVAVRILAAGAAPSAHTLIRTGREDDVALRRSDFNAFLFDLSTIPRTEGLQRTRHPPSRQPTQVQAINVESRAVLAR
jgi:hypothetical protein